MMCSRRAPRSQDIRKLLSRIEKVKAANDILRLYLVELKKSNIKDLSHAIRFDERTFDDTIAQILNIVSKAADGQSRLGVIQRLTWVTQKGNTQRLLQSLEEEQ